MSKKKDRAWFVSQQLGELVSQHYPNDELVVGALRQNPDPKVLARICQGTPVARSTLLKLLRRFAGQNRNRRAYRRAGRRHPKELTAAAEPTLIAQTLSGPPWFSQQHSRTSAMGRYRRNARPIAACASPRCAP